MPVHVSAIDLPDGSLLAKRKASSDFLDCFSVASDLNPRDAARIITDWPDWAKLLLLVRRIVTIPFGLSQGGPSAADKIGPFPVEYESQSELIAGFNDKHLDFRVSIMSRDGKVSLATWVHPHNFGGRLYLNLIMPFHIVIARNALARVATNQAF